MLARDVFPMLTLKPRYKTAIAGICPGRRSILIPVFIALLGPVLVQAQTASAIAGDASAKPLTLKEAAQLAVSGNPEVLARWHSIKAALAERDAAKGGLFPRVDLSAAAGPERRTDQAKNIQASGSLTLTQLLYDGVTRNEVKRLDHAAQVRLFEFFETSEATALEAARAYFDVLRYRELVRLAEDNFVDHRAVFAQTERRVRAKIARGVDLEQATGRLALSEANLLSETANLHDATARFQRVVGRLPTQEMPLAPELTKEIPQDAVSAIVRAQQRNGALLAAIENVRTAQAALLTRGGAFKPRIDLRLRREQGNNLPGLPGSSSVTAADMVLSWNLFSGFSDQAKERQFAEQVNVAKDLRDKTCRDIRQTLLIAFNDVHKLKEQLEYLMLHQTAVGKALIAYRQQFDIGQRTLLDVLDTENELFQARRALANAQQDLNIAYVRTHAGVGSLLQALELARLDTGWATAPEQWSHGDLAAQQCPAEPVTAYIVNKQALQQRAAELTKRVALLNARERALQEVNAPAVTTEPLAAADDRAVRDALEGWRAAWSDRNVSSYLQAYAPNFTPSKGVSREVWEERRRTLIGRAADVFIDVSDLTVTLVDPAHATAVFTQLYRSARYQDSVTKTLHWEHVDGRWLIVRESVGAPPQP